MRLFAGSGERGAPRSSFHYDDLYAGRPIYIISTSLLLTSRGRHRYLLGNKTIGPEMFWGGDIIPNCGKALDVSYEAWRLALGERQQLLLGLSIHLQGHVQRL